MPTDVKESNFFLIYIDESYDTNHYAYSALMVPVKKWNEIFQRVLKWRRHIKEFANIPVRHELHATDFTAGRSEPNKFRHRGCRGFVFRQTFSMLEKTDDIRIINAIDKKGNYMRLFERMMNRINRTLEFHNAYGILICDEGNENKLISLVRKMKCHNVIPDDVARYGIGTRNIPISRIVEDPVFKSSASSYFLQLVDFLAFGLLRNEHPVPNTHTYVQCAFDILDKTLVKSAFKDDPKRKGIIRA